MEDSVRNTESRGTRSSATFEQIAPRLRYSILAHGFYRTLMTFPSTSAYRAMSGRDRNRATEYMSLCREHFLAFSRYGSVRSEAVLQARDGIEQPRRWPWRAECIFDAWLSFRRLQVRNEAAEVEGWIPNTPNNEVLS
jgi:hypothetical protein